MFNEDNILKNFSFFEIVRKIIMCIIDDLVIFEKIYLIAGLIFYIILCFFDLFNFFCCGYEICIILCFCILVNRRKIWSF